MLELQLAQTSGFRFTGFLLHFNNHPGLAVRTFKFLFIDASVGHDSPPEKPAALQSLLRSWAASAIADHRGPSERTSRFADELCVMKRLSHLCRQTRRMHREWNALRRELVRCCGAFPVTQLDIENSTSGRLSARLTSDEEGTDVPNFEAAKDEAVIDIAELAKEILPGLGSHHELRIVVRNNDGAEVIKLAVNFELPGSPHETFGMSRSRHSRMENQ